MIVFLYLFPLIHSIPYIAQIACGDESTKEAVDEFKEELKDIKKGCEDEIDDWENLDECMEYYSHLSIYYSTGADINDVLKSINSNAQFVFVQHYKVTSIDFNNLPSEMVVFVLPGYQGEEETQSYKKLNSKLHKYMNMVSFDGSHRSILQLNQLLARKKIRETNSVIEIKGDMKNRVSFITFQETNVKFTDSDLNVPNVAFLSSSVDSASTNIKATYLYDYESFIDMNSELIKKSGFLQVEQYCVLCDLDKNGQSNYQVVYNKDSWSIQAQVTESGGNTPENPGEGGNTPENPGEGGNTPENPGEGGGTPENPDEGGGTPENPDGGDGGSAKQLEEIPFSEVYSLAYSLANKFNIISFAKQVEIIRPTTEAALDSYKTLNITVVTQEFYESSLSKTLEDQKYEFTVKAAGWDDISKEKRPKIVLNYDSSDFNYKKDDSFDFDVTVESLHKLAPKDNGKKKKGLSGGQIAGIVIGCVAFVAIVVVVVVIVVRKKKGVSNENSESN